MDGITTGALIAKALPKVEKVVDKFAPSVMQGAWDRLRIEFEVGFKEYLEKTIERYSTVRTILGSSQTELSSLYVNLYLGGSVGIIKDDDLLGEQFNGKKISISATAGSGKSMLMRYLFFMTLQSGYDKIPIYIELRELNQTKVSLRDFIFSKITPYIKSFSSGQFDYALSKGLICLFLDGFDELDYDARDDRAKEITTLEQSNAPLTLFVSSRPEQSFSKWESFQNFQLMPLQENQLKLLIEKIPYEAEPKRRFLHRLDDGLFKKHQEFLVNPLLAIMMLLTIDYISDIPGKIHLFYEYAFEALFKRHDATKTGNFQRKRHVDLPMDDYRRLFAYFAAITYMQDAISFSEVSCLSFIENSIKSSQIACQKEAFLKDLTDCTCLLVRDGLNFTFSHRSFQEYFTAFFLANVKTTNFEQFAPKLMERASFDNVFPMVAEMNKEEFEEWALPRLRELLSAMAGIDPKINPVTFARKIFGDMQLSPTAENAHFTVSKQSDRFTSRNVLYRCVGFFDLMGEENAEEKELVDSICNGKLLSQDIRFNQMKQFHEKKSEAFFEGYYPAININEEDNEWVARTNFGKFVAREPLLLSQIVEELALRVEQRREGLESMFGFGRGDHV